MRPRFIPAFIAVLAACLCWGQGSGFASRSDQAKSAASEEHGVLIVELTKPLNSKNVKPGATVEATVRVRQNGMSIPRSSKVVGHVTEVKSRSKGDTETTLRIVFDTITPPGGASPTPIRGMIKAVAPNPNSDVNTGGGGISYNDLKISAVASGPSQTHPPTPLLNEQSTGVVGIKNLQLASDGVLTSDGKEIKLETGTQILLNVTMQ
jgi:hypothetical protein